MSDSGEVIYSTDKSTGYTYTMRLPCVYPPQPRFVACRGSDICVAIQADEQGVYQVPKGYCEVKYSIPYRRAWVNPNPDMFKYNGA